MRLLQAKITRDISFTLLIAAALFLCLFSLAAAQDGGDGAASIGDRLGITGWRLWVFGAITAIGSMIAWLGGSLFDISISIFTTGMVNTIQWLRFDLAISEIWSIIRDVFNLLFIFGLIWAGFKIILGIDDAGSKRTIGAIVVAALLINFSLYISQVIVDFTNVAAYQVYQMISVDSTKTVLGFEVKNTSNAFVYVSGINNIARQDQNSTLRNEVGARTGEAETNTIASAIILGILFCIFYTILGFVLAACALMLFSRFFTLILLMIFSPVMFLGWILPGFKSYTNDWWSRFLKQALVGPAMLFMIYLSLRALQSIDTTAQDGGIMAVTLYLLIVTAFLWASLKVANSLGTHGAAMAMNTGKRWGKTLGGYAGAAAGGASFGAIGRLGRSTLGKRAQKYAESDAAKDAAANSAWGRARLNLARRVGDASFDARKVGGVGKKLGIGEGIQGYKTQTEEIIKREKAYADSLGQVSDDDKEVANAQLQVDATERAIEVRKEDNSKRQAEITRLQADKAQPGKTKKEQEQIQLIIDQKRAEIAQARGEIDTYKEQLDKQKEAVQKEKNRRQLGTIERNAPLHANRIDAAKKELKANLAFYADAREAKKKAGAGTPEEAKAEADMKKYAAEITAKKKEMTDEEKDSRKYDGGYASAVENQGWIKRKFVGGDKKQNEDAADEIRKEYKKKAKLKE